MALPDGPTALPICWAIWYGNPIGEDDPDFSAPDEITGVPDTEIYSSPDASDKSVNPVPATTTTDKD